MKKFLVYKNVIGNEEYNFLAENKSDIVEAMYLGKSNNSIFGKVVLKFDLFKRFVKKGEPKTIQEALLCLPTELQTAKLLLNIMKMRHKDDEEVFLFQNFKKNIRAWEGYKSVDDFLGFMKEVYEKKREILKNQNNYKEIENAINDLDYAHIDDLFSSQDKISQIKCDFKTFINFLKLQEKQKRMEKNEEARERLSKVF